MDLIDAIDQNTRRIVEIARTADPTTPVPTCGDWTLADLVHHVTEVQHFWHTVVATRAASPEGIDEPTRVTDERLADALDAARQQLVNELRSTDPSTACWSWSDDHTVGFTMRRQAHEALIHRLDAELAVGEVTPIDPELAADGIDELLGEFLGGIPGWAVFVDEPGVVELAVDEPGAVEPVVAEQASSRRTSWRVRFGRMQGTSPDSGRTYDLPAVRPADEEAADTHISADAATLDRWLWGRNGEAVAADSVRVAGDSSLVARLRDVIADATQ